MKTLSEALNPTAATLSAQATTQPWQPHGSTSAAGRSITTNSDSNVSQSPPSAATQASVLTPSLERELDLASRTQWNMEQAAGRLATIPGAVDKLQQEHERLTWALYPAHPDEIKALLGKLVLHFPQTNMEERHLRMLYEDYIEDLAQYPGELVKQACVTYRRNVENRFFPKVSELMALVTPVWHQMKHKHAVLEKLLKKMPESALLAPAIPAEAWSELRKTLETA